MIYVILGMHKSGTTLVSQILHHSGINMGNEIEDKVSYDDGNKYERAETKAINKEIIGTTRQSVLEFSLARYSSITEEQRARMAAIIKQCNEQYPNWGFKDPRTCLVYSAWASMLPEHKIIATYRSPEEVWPRFRPMKVTRRHLEPYWAWQFMQIWCKHNASVVSYLQNTSMKYLVLDYPKLMSTKVEFDRLQEFVGFKLEDQRKVSLYRSRPKRPIMLRVATLMVYKQTGWHPNIIRQQFEALRQHT